MVPTRASKFCRVVRYLFTSSRVLAPLFSAAASIWIALYAQGDSGSATITSPFFAYALFILSKNDTTLAGSWAGSQKASPTNPSTAWPPSLITLGLYVPVAERKGCQFCWATCTQKAASSASSARQNTESQPAFFILVIIVLKSLVSPRRNPSTTSGLRPSFPSMS